MPDNTSPPTGTPPGTPPETPTETPLGTPQGILEGTLEGNLEGPQAANRLTVVDHPLVAHKMALLRDKTTSTQVFRQVMREISLILGVEATRRLPVADAVIDTPLERGRFARLSGKKLCLVSVLRAGNGFLDGLLDLVPSARVGHIGIQRNHDTLAPETYFMKVPGQLAERPIILLDPMLATGGTAIAAASLLKQHGAQAITFLCLVAAPEGVDAFARAHPDIPIVTGALDRELSDIGYILPGLGDAGDRLFGTGD